MATLSSVLRGLGSFDRHQAAGILTHVSGGTSVEIRPGTGISWTDFAPVAARRAAELEGIFAPHPVPELDHFFRSPAGAVPPDWLSGPLWKDATYDRERLHHAFGVHGCSALVALRDRIGSLEPETAEVPAGYFASGITDPIIRRMERPLLVGTTAVPNDSYRDLTQLLGLFPSRRRPEEFADSNRPAIHVTFAEACAYAEQMARFSGHRVRLMRDYERERAERGMPVSLLEFLDQGISPEDILGGWGSAIEHGFVGAEPEAALASGARIVNDRVEIETLLRQRQPVWAFFVYGTADRLPPELKSHQPVRSTGPNDLGLFDLSGREREWVLTEGDQAALKGGWYSGHPMRAGEEHGGFRTDILGADASFRLAIEED